MTLTGHVSTCAIYEPGQWTPRAIAADLGIAPRSVVDAVTKLRRRRQIAQGRIWRLLRDVPEGMPRFGSMTRRAAIWEALQSAGCTESPVVVAMRATGLGENRASEYIAAMRHAGDMTPLGALFPPWEAM